MNLFLLAGIVVGVSALGVLLMYAVYRRARVDYFYEEIERGAGIFTFLGTAFAVLLASSSSRPSRTSTTPARAPLSRRGGPLGSLEDHGDKSRP